jgi:hypothetical protein
MKSRFSYKKQRDWPILVLRLKPKIDEILKKYDTSLSLEKDTPEIEAFLKDIDILFNQLIGARYWNVAKLTKALHRKRPKLIPMIDSIVCRKYNNITSQNRSPKDEIINQSIKALYELKNELINHLDDIKKIVNIANNRAPNLVPKNISNLRCLESLVFQQYFN